MRRLFPCGPEPGRAGGRERKVRLCRHRWGARLDGRDNALNFLRLVLASAVIVGHAYPLGGHGESRIEGLSGIAVDGFWLLVERPCLRLAQRLTRRPRVLVPQTT